MSVELDRALTELESQIASRMSLESLKTLMEEARESYRVLAEKQTEIEDLSGRIKGLKEQELLLMSSIESLKTKYQVSSDNLKGRLREDVHNTKLELGDLRKRLEQDLVGLNGEVDVKRQDSKHLDEELAGKRKVKEQLDGSLRGVREKVEGLLAPEEGGRTA